jgi:serine/threonine-protein kinase
LHELLTGSPAYVADTVPGLLAMIVADPPPPLSSMRADAPLDLEAIVLRCLEKDRERRYPSVAALARALERFATAETRPLVRRISRVLGEDAPPATEVAQLTPSVGFTVNEPVAQTNGTWARTGRLREGALSKRLYQRPLVQLAAAVGVFGIGFAAWLLGSSSSGSPGSGSPGSGSPGSPPAASPTTVAQAITPAVAVVPSSAATPLTQPQAILPSEPSGSAVHPIAEPPASAHLLAGSARAPEGRPAEYEEESEVKAPAVTRPGKKLAAVAAAPAVSSQKSHAVSPPKPQARPPRAGSEAASAPPASTAAAPTSKKADVDLWSDPK